MSAFKRAHSRVWSGSPNSTGYFHSQAALVKLSGSQSRTEGHNHDKRSGASRGVLVTGVAGTSDKAESESSKNVYVHTCNYQRTITT